jgi:hypothetical protein
MSVKFAKYLLLTLVLTGCISKAPLVKGQENNLKGHSLAVTVEKGGGLVAVTGGQVLMLGGFSQLSALSYGSKLMAENGIPDPAAGFAPKLARKLAQKYNMRLTSLESLPKDGVILTASTITIHVMYYVANMDNYYITISMQARLTNKDGQKIAEGPCAYKLDYEDSDQAPSWEDLFANRAAGLKAEIEKAENYCADKVMSEFFSL